MSDESIIIDKKDKIGIITINRPSVMNALDVPTILSLESAFIALDEDSGIRVIILTGAGDKAFVAGGDIADLNSRQALDHYQEFAEIIHRVFQRIENSDTPTLAAVNGFALGGGTELLLALDIRIASDKARLGLPEISLGLFPGAGGSQRIIRQVPLARAKELMFTGNYITAEEARQIGLVNRVVPSEQLFKEAMETAEVIASKSPLVLKLLKRSLRDGVEMSLSAALGHEKAVVSLLFDSKDAHEGCSAFLEKRQPKFEGR